MRPRQIQEHRTDPDELTYASEEAGAWGLPSDEGQVGQHPAQVPNVYDYAAGILVGHDLEADAQPTPLEPGHTLRARVDAPRTYETPHEATHRRYEPPRLVPIAQTAAGTLMFAAPNVGLHFVKLLALCVTLDATGTLQFVQGDPGGVSVAAIGSTQGAAVAGGMGAMNLAGNTPLVLPPADLQNPWIWTAPDLALGLVSGTGKANGWALVAYSPYDQ